MKIALCFCVRNCAIYLNTVFLNIARFKLIQPDIYCVFVYDNCRDNSANILFNYQRNNKNVIIKTIQNTDKNRTVRIAKARNECLSIVYNEISNVDYHIMIDCDNVNIVPWDIKVLYYYLHQNQDWDAISFNRPNFYDIWALLFDNYKQHCYGFNTEKTEKVIHIMRKDICKKLKECRTDSIDVLSAFNGFCMYKTQKMKGCTYDGLYMNAKKLTTEQEKRTNVMQFKKYNLHVTINDDAVECCEHIYYHLSAIKKGCKIKLSKYNLFEEVQQKTTPKLERIVLNKSN
jgi:hypothetical protein